MNEDRETVNINKKRKLNYLGHMTYNDQCHLLQLQARYTGK